MQYQILEEFKKLNKKWRLFVTQNSHTDLGYTHRQEWVYRAHWRYLEKVVDICRQNTKFKWCCETYWTVENFFKNTSEEYKKDFLSFVEKGNIEISLNYLNSTNLADPFIVKNKAIEAKKMAPKSTVAIFQDVNGIDREYAQSLASAGTKFVLGSIHTHHGLFASSGKQRGFWWKLNKDQKILIWNGEHYQIGNEMGLHGHKPTKYTFKDKVENESDDITEQGLIRMFRYLKKLEDEGYQFDSLIIPLSGYVTDNAAPSEEVLTTVSRFNELLPDNIELVVTNTQEFFESLEQEIKEKNISIPEEEGEWSDWWTDGALSTPEEIRLYREANRIYHIIKSWNDKNQKIDESKIKNLENWLAIFSEHTWGHYSSISDPFWTENNLLLARKKSMANEASLIAWSLLDEIREYEGESLIRLWESDEHIVFNPYDEEIEMTIPLQITGWSLMSKFTEDRFIEFIDKIYIEDNLNNIFPCALCPSVGGLENINLIGQQVVLTNVKLKPFEKRTLKIKVEEFDKLQCWTSSTRKVGAENVEDILEEDSSSEKCRFLRDGIENKYYKIKWKKPFGIISIYDKELKCELVSGEGGVLTPTYDVSKNLQRFNMGYDDHRRSMGRNRKTPNYKQSVGELIDFRIVENKSNVQLIDLIFKVDGCSYYGLSIRLTNLEKSIDFALRIRKDNERDPENLYFRLPFEKESRTKAHRHYSSYYPWEEQISNTCIDYLTVYKGVSFEKNNDFAIGVATYDTPMIQLGSIEYEQRRLMSKNLDKNLMKPYIWALTNYWETNFKGTTEGNYLFSYKITSGSKEKINKWMDNQVKSLISFPKYE